MLYKPKAYRHPVLAFYSPDYLPGNRFDCHMELNFGEAGSPSIQVSFNLENDYLTDLVTNGQAGLGLDILVSETVSRRFLWVDSFSSEFSLDAIDFFGEIEIAPLLVAKADMMNFRPEFINPEYQQKEFPVMRGEPLAIAPVFVAEIQPDYMQPIDPFEIVSRGGKEHHWYELDCSSNKLILSVSEELFTAVNLTKSDSGMAHMLYPSIYQDAVQAAIAEAQQSDYESKYWARLLRDRLLENGLPLDGEPQQIAAQYLFSLGWGKVLVERDS